jgi:hypothetical protein
MCGKEEGRPRTCADFVGARGREGDVVGWRGRVGDQGHVETSSRKTQVSFSLRHEPLKYSCVACHISGHVSRVTSVAERVAFHISGQLSSTPVSRVTSVVTCPST